MAYESVDKLQKTLAESVFAYATDQKKAAGRAMGTIVEIIAYYTLCMWELQDHIIIERSVPEFGNPDILHNVEFSLHPIRSRQKIDIFPVSLPITSAKIKQHLPAFRNTEFKQSQVLSSSGVKRNAAVLTKGSDVNPIVANLQEKSKHKCNLTVCELLADPYAIVECKRVGVEEGMRKGPQTIEKAKQGAYVARSVSSLQKVRLRNGRFNGVMEQDDGSLRTGHYDDLLRDIIDQSMAVELAGFILTVGIVSNHGNWFTSDQHNKELEVLAQSYDWLLFLSDTGLAHFIERLLLDPTPELSPARDAFLASYPRRSGSNRFTKVHMAASADDTLRRFFAENRDEIESWYNVISPVDGTLLTLRTDLRKLAAKFQSGFDFNDRWTQQH